MNGLVYAAESPSFGKPCVTCLAESLQHVFPSPARITMCQGVWIEGKSMRTMSSLIVAGAFVLLGSSGALSQTAKVPQTEQMSSGIEQREWTPAPRSVFSILGVPLRVSTPVAAPYRRGFEDFAGQPMTGRDVLAAPPG
jgi:hypothetical protein